jgi:hypothetical protein
MREPFWFCFLAFLSLFLLLLALRVKLAEQQAELDTLYLNVDDRRLA